MKTLNEIHQIVSAISYKPGWAILMGTDKHDPCHRPYIQVAVTDPSNPACLCPFTDQQEPWKGGKTYLSFHMCKQEIVGAVFGALRAAEEHEMREWFRYKDVSIYNPHLCPDALVKFARFKKHLDLRDNAMSMTEEDTEGGLPEGEAPRLP